MERINARYSLIAVPKRYTSYKTDCISMWESRSKNKRRCREREGGRERERMRERDSQSQ